MVMLTFDFLKQQPYKKAYSSQK